MVEMKEGILGRGRMEQFTVGEPSFLWAPDSYRQATTSSVALNIVLTKCFKKLQFRAVAFIIIAAASYYISLSTKEYFSIFLLFFE